jgi:protein TonB
MNKALSVAFIISILAHAMLILPIYPGSPLKKASPMEISIGSLRIVQERVENKRPELGEQKVATQTKALPFQGSVAGYKESYLSEIRRRIIERKRYPHIAREKGFEGISQVEFIISKEGEVEKISLIQSSNHQCLDKEVIDSVKRAAPFPPIPEAFSSSKIKVAIPVIFKLEGKS